jgi:hypothetical protein
MVSWILRILAAVLVLSLGYGSVLHAVDRGKFLAWKGWLRPVFSAEVIRAGYSYYESESPLGRAIMVRRHTGDEPTPLTGCSWQPMTVDEFFGGRVRETLDGRLGEAIDRGMEGATVESVGWRWPVWTREFHAGDGSALRASTKGFVAIGPVGMMTRPAGPAFVLWVSAIAGGFWAVERAGASAVRRLRRMKSPYGHCPSCLYDLAGIDDTVCPECGADRPRSRAVA